MSAEPALTVNLTDMQARLRPSEPADELVPREVPVRVKYRTPEGKLLECAVRSVVMDGDGLTTVARMEAELAGVAWDRLPQMQQGRFHAIATVVNQLHGCPPWLHQWMQMDEELLDELFTACLKHSRRYLRRDPATGRNASPQSRVEVFAEALAAPGPTGIRSDASGPGAG